jgi:V/A-type H+-transporting ATPase subunit E
MKTLEKGQEKIQRICDSLRVETLEPAKAEAAHIIEEAKHKAAQIVSEGKQEAERIHANARMEIEREHNVFQSSLLQASKQSLEALRQSVEERLFNDELEEIVRREMVKPNVVADIVKAVIAAIEDKGVEANLEVIIPSAVSAKEVNALLGDNILKKLKNNSVVLGNIGGGAQVKLVSQKLTLVMTDDELRKLMAQYVRKDFRKMLFSC